MTIYLNGRFVSDKEATLSIFDRGFLYGDGLFETIRAYQSHLFQWTAHWHRLNQGAAALGIELPWSAKELHAAARQVLARNQLTDAIVRLSVSRGVGPRGYSPRGAKHPTLVIAAFPAPGLDALPPPPRRLRTARLRLLAGDPLAGFKTSSKLVHVLARAEAETAGAEEGLLLNHEGNIAEATSANLFWFVPAGVCTPALDQGCLAGVTRELVFELVRALGWTSSQVAEPPEALRRASGVFLLGSSGSGLVEVGEWDGQALRHDDRITRLQSAYRDAIRHELAELSD